VEGWSWQELDMIDERSGGATRAQRDALKLLAVFIQHSDSKPEQQRLICLDDNGGDSAAPCMRPFMLINDLGLTFGRANLVNANSLASANLVEWRESPVWKGSRGCVGNLPKSLTGTLKDPVIGEDGRRFLATLLLQLSDAQLHDLFEAARFERRRSADINGSGASTVDEWVEAFKQKREEILERRCLDPWSAVAPPTFETGWNRWLQSRSTPALAAGMKVVSLLGYNSVYMAIAVMLTFGYRARAGAALLLLLALNIVVVDATKTLVSSPRPDLVDSRVQKFEPFPLEKLVSSMPESRADDADPYGFPSGHVAGATVFFFGLVFLFGWRWAWGGLALWVPVVALSRLYLGRHFLGDVLGGFGAAVIVTAIGLQALILARLSATQTDARRIRRIAVRVVVTAAALAGCSAMLGVPDPYDAGRFLGIALGVMLLVWEDRVFDVAPPSVRIGRIALTAMVFIAVWWGASLTVDRLTVLDGPIRALIAGMLPGVALLSGAILRDVPHVAVRRVPSAR
jgi:membrane-associated phospholipid phosphatase